MSPGRYKVKATVDPVVLHMSSVEATLVRKVLSELFVDVGGTHAP